MPVRKMPGGGYEAGTGGRHSQAQAGQYFMSLRLAMPLKWNFCKYDLTES